MKTTIRKSVLVALMFGTLSGYAMGTTNVKGNKTETRIVNTIKTEQLWSIIDSEGNVVYTQKNQTLDSFDSLKLKDGEYTLEIEKGFEIQVTPLQVTNGVVSLERKKAKTIHIPVFRKESNKVLVSQLAVDSKALEVTIYFEGEIIFDDVVTGGTVLGRVYKLRKDIKGDYKVVMKANDRIYTKEFSL